MNAPDTEKAVLAHTTKNKMLCIAKAVMSLVAGIFAGIMFVTGVPVLSTTAMTVLSLATALVAIRRDLHKNEGPV